MIGRTIGPYRVVEQAGSGGMAIIYKSYDPSMDRFVALKVLPEHFMADPTFRERFHREAKSIAKLEHQSILPIYDYGEDQGVAYMAMRYMPSGTLGNRIEKGPLPLPEASRLLNQMASALDYAHSNNILHRDIKPSNVLIDENSNTYLTDFGVAKMLEATLALTGDSVLGTPAYMSPEQCEGGKELTVATDIYSLGVVLYEMVTGRRPFDAETPMATVLQQLHSPLPPPSQFRTDLSDMAERTLFKALAKEPEARYASAGDFAAAFANAVAVDAVPAAKSVRPPLPSTEVSPPPQRPLPTRSWNRPSWLTIFLAGIVIVAIAAVIVLLLTRGDSVSDESDAVAGQIATSTPLSSPTEPPTIERQSTEVPTAIPTAEPGFVFFDDFDDPTYDGSVDPEMWLASHRGCQQQEGNLEVGLDCSLQTAQNIPYVGRQFGSVTARMQINSGYELDEDEWAHSFVSRNATFGKEDGRNVDWTITCGILAEPSKTVIHFHISDSRLGPDHENLYFSEHPIEHDKWYELQLRVIPDTMKSECLVDGNSIGSYMPENIDELQNIGFTPTYIFSHGNSDDVEVKLDYLRYITPYSSSEN